VYGCGFVHITMAACHRSPTVTLSPSGWLQSHWATEKKENALLPSHSLPVLSDTGRWETKQRFGRVLNATRGDWCNHTRGVYVALPREVECIQTQKEIGWGAVFALCVRAGVQEAMFVWNKVCQHTNHARQSRPFACEAKCFGAVNTSKWPTNSYSTSAMLSLMKSLIRNTCTHTHTFLLLMWNYAATLDPPFTDYQAFSGITANGTSSSAVITKPGVSACACMCVCVCLPVGEPKWLHGHWCL